MSVTHAHERSSNTRSSGHKGAIPLHRTAQAIKLGGQDGHVGPEPRRPTYLCTRKAIGQRVGALLWPLAAARDGRLHTVEAASVQ